MINIRATLTETQQTVLRPLVFNIVDELKKYTKLPKDAKIYFAGESERLAQPGSTLGNEDRLPLLNNNRIIYIEVEEKPHEEYLLTTTTTEDNQIPFFLDKNLGVLLRPIYSFNEVTINLKFRTPSKTEALRWVDEYKLSYFQSRYNLAHSVSYNYPVPISFLLVLEEIYNLRENIAGYGQTFQEYVVSNSSSTVGFVSDLVNRHTQYSVAETQAGIMGNFDFSELPEAPEKTDELGIWTVTIPYKFTYHKPIACHMRYPIMVHNQMLPSKYYDFYTFKDYYDKTNYYSPFNLANINNTKLYHINRKHLSIPEEDPFILPKLLPGVCPLVSCLCQITPEDQKTILDLNDLGDYIIDADILNFMKSEYLYITKFYGSLLQTYLIINNTLVDMDFLNCDSNLVLKSLNNLSLRNTYRIVIGVVTNLTLLTPGAIARIRNYPKALQKIVLTINESFERLPGIKELGGRTRISEADVLGFGKYINSNRDYFDPDNILHSIRQNFIQVAEIEVSH